MEYRSGSLGRVFMVRFDHGDDPSSGLQELCRKENLRQAWFQVLGGIARAGVVTGPREPVMPPEPVWAEADGAHEVIGSGSIYFEGDEPRIHFHAAMGQHGETLTACVRRDTRTYLILEMVIFEVTGMELSRPWYEQGGFNRLTFA